MSIIDDNVPIYLQISNFIEEEILNGRLQIDEKVPSTNDFSRIMKINPATAGKGLNELVDQGILYKKRGLGMFVNKDALNIIIKKRRYQFNHEIFPNFIKEAKQLQIGQDELIEMIRGDYHA